MTIKFTGDFKKLDRFAHKLARAERSLEIVSENLAEETIDLIRDGFKQGTDPYGKPWEPIETRSGQPLQDTGGLRSSWHKRFAVAGAFSVESGKDYAIYHQRGTGIYGPRNSPIVPVRAQALRIPGIGFRKSVKGSPQRRMVPDGRLPRAWRRRYIETATDVLTDIFGS